VRRPPAERYCWNAWPARNKVRHRGGDKPNLANHGIEFFDSRIANRQICINNVVDRKLVLRGSTIQLPLRPFAPERVVRDEIREHIRVDQDQGSISPRVSAISSSVVMANLALPRRRANTLSGGGCSALIKTRPSSASSKSDPGLRPRRSRDCLGIVTCPLPSSLSGGRRYYRGLPGDTWQKMANRAKLAHR
jgi:hypothetical protein